MLSSLRDNRLRYLLAVLVETNTWWRRANLAVLDVAHTHDASMNSTRYAVFQLDVQLWQRILLIH